MKSDVNPMHRAHLAARCHATAKSTGKRCNAPAVTGSAVCRMHGARGGAPTGHLHPNYRHGTRSRSFEAMRRHASKLARQVAEFNRES